MRWFIVGLLVAACSNKAEPPAKPAQPPVAVAEPPVEPTSVMPVRVLDKLGEANTVFVMDVGKIPHAERLASLIPGLDCAKEIFASSGIIMVFAFGDTFEGYISKLPWDSGQTCIRLLAPKFGASTAGDADHFEIVAGSAHYSLQWVGTTVHITEVGHPPHGKLSAELRALMTKVPTDVLGWLASRNMMGQFANTTAWGTLEGDPKDPYWHTTIVSGANEAKTKELFSTFENVTRDMAAKKGIQFDETWIKVDGQRFDVRLPLAVMIAMREE